MTIRWFHHTSTRILVALFLLFISSGLFLFIVVGSPPSSTPRLAIALDIFFGWQVILMLGTAVAYAVVRRRLNLVAVSIILSTALVISPATVAFQTHNLPDGMSPGEAEFNCLTWRHPIYPTAGSWDVSTLECMFMSVIELDGTFAVGQNDLRNDFWPTSRYWVTFGLSELVVLGGPYSVWRMSRRRAPPTASTPGVLGL